MDTDDMITPEDTDEQDTKRLDLESVDDDYDEWVICDPVDRWEKNGMTCVVEEKKWYRRPSDDPEPKTIIAGHLKSRYERRRRKRGASG
jgi:hypothetical protein